ncbi:MAG TPA: hypothetical protein DCS07_06490, partial [Bdellovibrionales bacterium]|nr:hypothetical protein [Bdellovibrionales bacterium]
YCGACCVAFRVVLRDQKTLARKGRAIHDPLIPYVRFRGVKEWEVKKGHIKQCDAESGQERNCTQKMFPRAAVDKHE